MKASLKKSSGSSARLFGLALLSIAAFLRAGDSPIRVLSPSAEAVTDADAYPVELSVEPGAGLTAVVLIRRKPAGMEPCKLRVEAGKEALLPCEAALSPGRNLFSVYGLDGQGRKVQGPSFRIFKTLSGGPSAPSPAPSKTPLPFLQPASPPAPEAPKAPPPPTPVREYGKGRCGYPMFQTMSIPVVENGRTRYVFFKTDGNGCLPPEVELK